MKKQVNKEEIRKMVEADLKDCRSCNQQKSLSAFYSRKNGASLRYSTFCKECTKIARKENHQPLKKKDYDLQRCYNITIHDFKVMYEDQKGQCKICNKAVEFMSEDKTKSACVDHCHTTGKVRGLLCHSCNRALGLFQDDSTVLANAIKYLNEAIQETT